MSLEAALQANTEALHRLAVLLDRSATLGEVKADAKKEPPTISDATAAEIAEVKKRNAASTEAIDYEKQVKPAVLAFAAKKGREPLIALLKPFGITTAKDAKPEQYAELLKALQEGA